MPVSLVYFDKTVTSEFMYLTLRHAHSVDKGLQTVASAAV